MNPARAIGPAVVSGYLEESNDNVETHAVSTVYNAHSTTYTNYTFIINSDRLFTLADCAPCLSLYP